ncbi:hypothetical protein [Shewanella cyperi]|uniref:hypothetical protein n=1 Tax=Shewanella cyperi TaxID=2814292 RepID=UPI001A93E663|nr:hypothetical protein [Shewanella cyperi]QSX39375.1 hypothetical protein JYB84_09945 [Shewanella cyperi]
MSKLTKEEVIAALEAALEQQQGRKVVIEQKGSWYKIDDGKSLRFGELEAMLAELSGAAKPVAAKKAAPAKPTTAKPTAAKAAPTKKPAVKTDGNTGGLTPKELWRQKLQAQRKNQLPRGF